LIHEITITQCNGGWMVPEISWVPVSLDTTGCNDGDTGFTMLLNNVTFPNNYWMLTWVDVNGVRYMDEHFQSWFISNGTYTWGLYDVNTGGSATGVWPLPPNTPIHINFIITDGQFGPTVSRYTAHMTQCNGGTILTEFNDVSHYYYESMGGVDYALYPYVAALFNAGMTSGTSSNPPLYSPTTILNRAMAAVFMLRANFGIAYTPPGPPYTTFAADNWSLNSWAQPWAQGMWNAHLTAGCQSSPLMFCPDRILTREEAVVFALHMKYDYYDGWGNLVSYTPPPATGNIFADLTNPAYWSAPWAEKAYLDGIIPACGWSGGKPLFCQFDPVDRAWAAYLIVKAAGLTLPLP
jgi:hypothetical protein